VTLAALSWPNTAFKFAIANKRHEDLMAKRYLFHGEASAASGSVTSPSQEIIPVQAAVSLPIDGGTAASRVEQFAHSTAAGNILAFDAAYCQSLGYHMPEMNAYGTMVTATVEGLNILDIVTASRIVARLSSRHFIGAGQPNITVVGSYFENLRIGGKLIDIDLATDVFDRYDTFDKLTEAWDKDQPFREWITRSSLEPAASGEKPVLSGILGCTLVRGISNPPPEVQIQGGTITIKQFGTIELATLFVRGNQRHLTMLRAELRTPPSGSLSIASGSANGTFWP
jgi:hypothetical protein